MIRKMLVAISSLLALALVCLILVVVPYGNRGLFLKGSNASLFCAIRKSGQGTLNKSTNWDFWKAEARVVYRVQTPKDRLTILHQDNPDSYPNARYTMEQIAFPIGVRDDPMRQWERPRYYNNDIYWAKRFGFNVRVRDSETTLFGGFGDRTYSLAVPLWAVATLLLLFCIYPITTFIRGPYRRYRRGKKGHCLKCGYNLTGNVSGVCPECGEKI